MKSGAAGCKLWLYKMSNKHIFLIATASMPKADNGKEKHNIHLAHNFQEIPFGNINMYII